MNRRSNILSRAIADRFFDDWYKSVVVLANPKTVINTRYAKKEIKDQIIRCDQLVEYIKILNTESKNPQESDKRLYSLGELFLELHSPNTADFTKKYQAAIQETDAPAITETTDDSSESRNSAALEDTPLYKALRQYRLDKSREEKVKPYFIYNNAQMEELIKCMPKTLDEIKEIPGFGDVKCQKYGADILSIIDRYRY